MSCSRESTKQEFLIEGIICNIRRLDKLTWYSYDRKEEWREELVRQAVDIKCALDMYIDEINRPANHE